MRALRLRRGLTVASLAAALGLALAPSAGADEPGLFGRLFRLGGSNSSKPAPGKPASPFGAKPAAGAGHVHDHDQSPNQRPGPGQAPAPIRDRSGDAFIPPAAAPAGAVPPGAGPSTPEVADAGSAPPITPRSRVSNAATEADPLLTRMALGRSNDGARFGMFMQIFADGTVIDSEGVHRLSPADIKPLADLVASGELGRNRGHCGAPSGDYIEEVHVVVFERRLGRLTAQPFSYSGNPQGCEPSVRQLHAVIDNLQLRLSGQPAAAVAAAPIADAPPAQAVPPVDLSAPAPEAAPTFSSSNAAPALAPPPAGAGRVLPPLGEESGPVIPLTSDDPR